MLAQLNKPAVQLIIFLVVVGGASAFFLLQKQQGNAPVTTTVAPATAPGATSKMGQSGVEQLKTKGSTDQLSTQTQSAHIDKFVVPPPKAEPPRLAQTKAPQKQEKPKPPVFPSLVQVNKPLPIKPFVAQPPKVFAPRGTLIKAAMVLTAESNALDTPVVALVTEDVWFQGKLIVPVGTQVQAHATAGKVRDRIDVRGAFTFVWDDGKEYQITAIALDHEPLPDGTYALTDGSAGIRGRILKTDDYAEVKLLISQALTAVLQSQQSSFQSIYGVVPQNTASNASLSGAAGGTSAYANLLSKKLEKDIEYVQVPAGTQFYIYTLDVFEPELRSIAGLKQGNAPKAGTEMQLDEHKARVAMMQNLLDASKAQQEESKVDAALRERELQHQMQIEKNRALLAPLQTTSRPPDGDLSLQPVLQKTP